MKILTTTFIEINSVGSNQSGFKLEFHDLIKLLKCYSLTPVTLRGGV